MAEDSKQAIRNMLPEDDVIYSLAELFKMFGDPTRAKILQCLQIRDLYVGEIAASFTFGKTRQGNERRQRGQVFAGR